MNLFNERVKSFGLLNMMTGMASTATLWQFAEGFIVLAIICMLVAASTYLFAIWIKTNHLLEVEE